MAAGRWRRGCETARQGASQGGRAAQREEGVSPHGEEGAGAVGVGSSDAETRYCSCGRRSAASPRLGRRRSLPEERRLQVLPGGHVQQGRQVQVSARGARAAGRRALGRRRRRRRQRRRRRREEGARRLRPARRQLVARGAAAARRARPHLGGVRVLGAGGGGGGRVAVADAARRALLRRRRARRRRRVRDGRRLQRARAYAALGPPPSRTHEQTSTHCST